jgi:hypothetical protein
MPYRPRLVPEGPDRYELTLENSWAALVPELLWPAWGLALGAATLAYHLRRSARTLIERHELGAVPVPIVRRGRMPLGTTPLLEQPNR